jgi:hypothetical protein
LSVEQGRTSLYFFAELNVLLPCCPFSWTVLPKEQER